MRTRALAVALLVLAATAAATAQTAPPGPRVSEVPGGVVRVLDDLGRAWKTHDSELLANLIRPGRVADRALSSLANAAALQFDDYSFRAGTQFSGDIAHDRVRGLHPGAEVAAFHVIEESRIGGFDLDPYVEDSFYTFARSDRDGQYDGWRLVSTSDFEPLGAYSTTHLWDAGPVSSAASEHFLLLAHSDQLDRTRPVLQVAESAYAADRAFWPRQVGERYVIVAPSTTQELRDMVQSTVDLSKFVAFAAATINTEQGYVPAGVRIFLHMSHYTRYSAEGRKIVLGHEILHAVTRPQAGPFVPSFVEEGLALAGSEPENRAQARRGAHDRFPTDDEFYVGPTRDIVTVYFQGQVAIAALVAHSGVDGLARFYESLGSARVVAGTQEYHLGRALQGALSWTVDDWTKAWRSRLG